MTRQFRAKITLYRKDKIIHVFDAQEQESATEAVKWATQRSLLDAEWADEKWGTDTDGEPK